jgi:hypothetical protein
MRRFVDPAPANPSEDETLLRREVPEAREQATESPFDAPERAPTAKRRGASTASAGAQSDTKRAAVSLPVFPSWARSAATRYSEKRPRRGADDELCEPDVRGEGRETKGSVEQGSPERLIEGRTLGGAARSSAGEPAVQSLGPPEEGRGLPDSDARSAGARATGAYEAAFLAGAALAALDPIPRAEQSWRGCWGARLALEAAAASARLLGRAEDESALRDAFTLRRPGDDPGPAGRLLVAWRRVAGRRPDLVFGAATAEKIARDLGLPPDVRLGTIVEEAAALARSDRPAVFAAADAAAFASRSLEHAPVREREILALLLADAVLAAKLRWPVFVPLLAGAALHPSLRKGSQGKRPRPGDPDWAEACCLAYARAAESAHDRARDLARRAERLEATVPKLRAKGAEAAVASILEEDAVTAAMRPGHLSERAARRMFDRLVSLGALRELTGRPTFRLYGL